MDLARYADLFRTESREHLAEMDVQLLALEQDHDASHVASLFRSTHTIKGMAASMGYHGVEQLSHALETLLDGVRSGTRALDADLIALLFDGTDALAQAVDDAVEGRTDETQSRAAALLERLASAAELSVDVFPAALATPVEAARSASNDAREVVRTPDERRTTRETLRHVRIDLRRLDTLLDLVGELVITRDRLVRTSDQLNEGGTTRAMAGAVHDTARLINALQEEVLRTRMVPVGQVFDRFPRLVRDVARDLGKEITFVTEGREIELDRSLLDAIGDPIVHLLRNAIDHGIETADKRREAGKPANGRLVLRAARDRAAVVVQVEDDGRGVDRQAVLERARREGLVDTDAENLSDDGLLRVLARAGFSTAQSITAVSGRGVGIDVVASRVRALGGTLEMRSQAGVGTTFTLRLPVTLAIVRALLVKIGSEAYALPTAHVMEALEFDATNVVIIRGEETVTLRDDVIPLLRLRQRFGMEPGSDVGAHLVIVDAAGRRIAVLADSLIGQQDIVVKPYDAVHGAESLFTGATILGDGIPALIVDLGGLT